MSDGVTDAQVAAEVEKRTQGKQPKTLNDRLDDLYRNLGKFMDAYLEGLRSLSESESQSALRSPLGTVAEGLAEDGSWETVGVSVRPTNPPESRSPAGGDNSLRSALIRSTQRIADAIRALLFWEWDWEIQAWEPQELAYTRDGKVLCDADGAVCWRPDNEPITPLLADPSRGVDQLRGLLAYLQGREWDEADEIDRGVLVDALKAGESAVGTLMYHGVWYRPSSVPRCKVRACNKSAEKNGSGYRDTCSAHRKARQRAA